MHHMCVQVLSGKVHRSLVDCCVSVNPRAQDGPCSQQRTIALLLLRCMVSVRVRVRVKVRVRVRVMVRVRVRIRVKVRVRQKGGYDR